MLRIVGAPGQAGAMTLRSFLTTAGPTVLLFATVGCGSEDSSPPPVSQTLRIVATEYAFSGEPATITAGETIRFELVNEGQIDHELQLLNGDGRVLGQVDRLAPGESGTVEVYFESPGVYTAICDIDDHQTLGQRAPIEVE